MNIEIAPKETEVRLSWEEATIYCQFLDYKGIGWRLPNKEELNWMYGNKTDEMEFEESLYWSSTEFENIFCWQQSFKNGEQTYGFKSYRYLVRAIRTKS